MEWIRVFASIEEGANRVKNNRPQLLIIHDTRICLILRDKHFLAVQDSCPHNGESLSRGTINHFGEIICPLHSYRFQLKTGRESDERCRDLKTYPVKEDETGVYVGL